MQSQRDAVAYFRGKTWNVQRRIPVPPTPTNYAERHWRSPAALHWLKHRWNVRWHKAKHRLASLRLPMTNDWATAVRIVQRVWPGTSIWLLSCSSGEGGWSYWKWNGGAPYGSPHYGSDAGGWMQFFRGTYDRLMFGAYGKPGALAEAKTRHLARPPWRAMRSKMLDGWLSPLAQAFAAGWARYHHATSDWDPRIDAACA